MGFGKYAAYPKPILNTVPYTLWPVRTYSKSNKKKFDTNVRYLHSPMTDNANAASVK